MNKLNDKLLTSKLDNVCAHLKLRISANNLLLLKIVQKSLFMKEAFVNYFVGFLKKLMKMQSRMSAKPKSPHLYR